MDHTAYWLVGGDERQAELARLLARRGARVFTYALEGADIPAPQLSPAGIGQAGHVLLPMPISQGEEILFAPLSGGRHPLPLVLDALRPQQRIFGGRCPPDLRPLFAQRGLTLLDYAQRRELAVANAVPTARGKGRHTFLSLS